MIRKKLKEYRLVSVQFFCALIVVTEFIVDIIDKKYAFLPWNMHEHLEVLEVISIIILIIITFFVLREKSETLENEKKRNRVLTLDISVLINEVLYENNLTKTERDIAWLNIKGYSNSEIAELRDTTESTVKKHQTSIFTKFNVSNRNGFLSEVLDRIIDGRMS